MQDRETLQQPAPVLYDITDAEMLAGIEHALQRRPLVPGLQVIEAASPLGRHHLREDGRDDPPCTPLLHDQGAHLFGVVRKFRAQRFQHQRLSGEAIGHPIEQRRSRVVQLLFDRQPVEFLTGLQAGWQRQPRAVGQRIAQVLSRHFAHPQDDRTGVVAAATGDGQAGQRRSRLLRIRVRKQCRLQSRRPERRPDAVGTEQETVASLQVAIEEIELQVAIEPDRTRQHVAELRMVPDVVARQATADPASQQVEPAVTDVGTDVAAPAQNDRGQRRRHAGEFCLPGPFGQHPAVQSTNDLVERVRHAPGVGRRVVVREQSADRILGGFTPPLMTADTVGDGGEQSLVLEFGPQRGDHAAEVLVAITWTGQRRVADVNSQRHAGRAPERKGAAARTLPHRRRVLNRCVRCGLRAGGQHLRSSASGSSRRIARPAPAGPIRRRSESRSDNCR
ncbi:MAG: hypothetical protein AW07_00699 [Candidatus Accumulibacter sp. SK-11]|nr:MAG: hypothetical protein AW07_00699 [Candidatus Accumulibacter sp. SK-11]